MAVEYESSMMDETYDFSAPRFFDFLKGETDEDIRKAELWFDTALSYAPSPFMPRIGTARSVKVDTLCDFSEVDPMPKNMESANLHLPICDSEIKLQSDETTENKVEENKEDLVSEISANNSICADEDKEKSGCYQENGSSIGRSSSSVKISLIDDNKKKSSGDQLPTETRTSTPKPTMTCQRNKCFSKDEQNHRTAKKIASLIKSQSALKPKSLLQSKSKSATPLNIAVIRDLEVKKATTTTPKLLPDNRAIKRQKLEGERSRQIITVKPPHNLPHKTKAGLTSGTGLCYPVSNKSNKENRKVYVREPAAPFVSMAEMMNKFQSSTRDLSLPYTNRSLSHSKPAPLSLTRPKEPEFETAQRIRFVKVKSTAELEEEMMAKIPKFKARPLNKKILEAPTLQGLPRSTPQPPEFQEFHFMTIARAKENTEIPSVASSSSLSQHTNQSRTHLTEPKTPVLQTMLRARPVKLKSSFELELEQLEKVPKFKARPLNKKILESKGEMGIFCNEKKHVTKPQEFHFATNERIPPPASVADLFDKMSLNSEACSEKPLPRNTIPNPFHLLTEERGAEKERKFGTEILEKHLEEEIARIPRANPYPYTTDYPVIPQKPEPKQCTKPEPFQLESLVRHEEELQREAEERLKKEKEEGRLRLFKAQPVMKEDPIPLPEKVRKPLTQVQDMNLHVDNRAVDRSEFNEMVKKKEMVYKRYREESEAARMIEEDKALKHTRRTMMVPHAKPMPSFDNPFCPQKSCKVTTKPRSPKLRVMERKERRTLMMSGFAASAASNMR